MRHSDPAPGPERPPVALSVVIPCYNEEGSLKELHRRVRAVCEGVAPDSFEIVLVDDGSKDRTRQLIREFAEQDMTVVGVFRTLRPQFPLQIPAGLKTCCG